MQDLLDLKLHTHADAVSEIVDGANKEQKMDEIEGVWRGACLDYLPHKDSDVRVVRVSSSSGCLSYVCLDYLPRHNIHAHYCTNYRIHLPAPCIARPTGLRRAA